MSLAFSYNECINFFKTNNILLFTDLIYIVFAIKFIFHLIVFILFFNLKKVVKVIKNQTIKKNFKKKK